MKSLIIKLLYIIIIPIIVYDLILIVQTAINPGSTPDVFGLKTFTIITGSMQPEIDIDDLVMIKKVDESELKANDIISFNMDGDITTHRIINIDNDGYKKIYTTKGDNNKVSDIEKIEFNQIEGKYIGRIPKVGKILTLIKNKTVFAIIILGLILCYILEDKKIERKIERKEKRRRFDEINKKIDFA